MKPDVTIHNVLSGTNNAKKAVYETEYGLHIIPGSLLYKKVDALKLKEHLIPLKKYYDVILIDSSPSLNDEILATMMAADELFVITTPDHVTLSTTLRAVRLAKERNTPINGLILNKVHNKDFELSLDEIEATSNCNVLAVLPYEINMLEALSKNVPSTMYKQKSDASIEFKQLAAALLGEEYRDKRFKSRIKSLFGKTSKQHANRNMFKENLLKVKHNSIKDQFGFGIEMK